ncbi:MULTISPECIES: hypothetical protein [Microbacterium]|uniref:Uncharacterized protein n=1 Tax=Microbacterium testaceum (strain StLB037) TaxID=979556 RepID=A0A1H0Q6U1_MICTS|nr:hypothetical protein [Microbacterium testaceum]SDP13054.1 hypothetical protein SAMN04487788_2264 [Microbacterium testaceum StLB037]
MSEPLSTRPTAHARVVFDTFRSARDPRLSAWLLFRSYLLPELAASQLALMESPTAAGALAPIGVFGVWRLLATNNRELARCATVFASPSVAVDAARVEQSRADQMQVSTVRGPVATKHAWVLRRGDRPIATAARWYESAGEASAAGRAAVAVFRSADVVEGVSIGSASGRRSRVSAQPA